MPEPSREAYLAELDALLPFPSERRAEILEEIGAHLHDAAADGLSEARAQARLGAPLDLARELARPEQSPMRLLAAAGAGVRAAIGPWLYGYLLASLVVAAAMWTLSAVLMLISSLVTLDLAPSISGGWTTAATAAPIAVALYFGARAATSAASMAGHRLRADIQPWVAGIGTAVAAVVLVLIWETQQNAASVMALAIAPLGAALGAYRPNLLPMWPRIAPMAAVIVALLLIGVGVVTYGLAPPTVSYGEEVRARSLEERTAIVGPSWGANEELPLFEESEIFTVGGTVSGVWHPRYPGLLDELSDFRIEAWHTRDDAEWLLDLGYREPFATGPLERSDDAMIGSVVTNRDPDVHAWLLVLTGRGPDGVRYVLDASASGQSTFTGTAWDWIVAVAE